MLTTMRFILLLLTLLVSNWALSAELPIENQIRKELEQAREGKVSPARTEQIQLLQTALNSLDDRNASLERAAYYQQVITNYPRLINDIRQQLTSLNGNKTVNSNITDSELNQEIVQVNSRLLEINQQLQQEQDQAREINESLTQLPQQLAAARRLLNQRERAVKNLKTLSSPQNQSRRYVIQAEYEANKARVNELELAQLSANNRQELARIRADLHQRQAKQLDNYLQALRNQRNILRQREAEQALAKTEKLAEYSGTLPTVISEQFDTNRELSNVLNQQAQQMDLVASQQRQAASKIMQVRQVLTTLREQSQWFGASSLAGETLRAQIARLPEKPQPSVIDNVIADLGMQRLSYEEKLEQLTRLRQLKQTDGSRFTPEQRNILKAQLKIQEELLLSLISGYDSLLLEYTRLKVANSQLWEALRDVKEAAHRYLFWTVDVKPLTLGYPLEVMRLVSKLFSLSALKQVGLALGMMLTSSSTLLLLAASLLVVGISISSRRRYRALLARSASKIGKVTQDHFRLTFYTVFWSVLIATPLPLVWVTLGYGLQHAWPYRIAVALGDGITATAPFLWALMISASLARPDGLFIAHFRWPTASVSRAMKYYSLTFGAIVPLSTLLIAFANLEERHLYAILGRLCFILICVALSIAMVSLKRAGIPLHLDKQGNGDNMLNRLLWNLMIVIPLFAALASCVGYLATARALLTRLETSVAIWFSLLVVYYIIRRWMLIQRRRIAFDRARTRRAEILANRARGDEERETALQNSDTSDIEEPVIDLDAISARSLQLVRSILTLIAFISVILLWSEIHSAFSFLENIHLWDATTTIQGVENIQPITLVSLIIAVLVLIITLQLVRNMPALLELALLQHMNLTPGSGYAITTLTKYVLILVGVLTACSILGIEWSKLQWLVAALGLGLGIGLQEIFANFISGLMILFERPIRIGDTVTIRDLTGSVTRINTRATTITDWDRKEIIVPNKAFITEQFINWSLSDAITRVVLTIPAPADIESERVRAILQQAAECCSYVLDTPPPEAFLVDIQQGIQLFELRLFAAEMGHRMPLRHEIHRLVLEGFAAQQIKLPFPPFQVRIENVKNRSPELTTSPAQKPFRSGDV